MIRELEVEYFQLNMETGHHQCGYYNIPLGLGWAEKNLPLDYIIHIDLDMVTLKKFTLPMDGKIHIGRLNDLEKKPFHMLTDIELTFESNFICAPVKAGFFSRWGQMTEQMYQDYGKQDKLFYPEIEEFAIDYLYKHESDKFEIVPHIDYQVGARYPLKNIQDIHNVKFYHGHAYEPKEDYIKWKLQTR
jgi:hypothetical protein